MLLIFLIWLLSAAAIPRRGNEPWSIVLCKFRDTDFEPRTAGWFREWITTGNNPDTIESYFSSVSNAIYTIRGSNATEWLRLPWSRADVRRMADEDPRLQVESEKPFAMFDKAKQLCVSFAQQSGYSLYRQKITVINAEQTAVYGKDTGVLITPRLIFSSVLAHEMIHSMNIGHSYSDRQRKVFPYSSPGEYDDHYDLMSTANAHMRPSTYGLSGPGLNGPHLDYLGWLPMNRLVYFGRDGRQNYTLRLSSISVPHRITKGWLLVILPYDRDDPRNVYTIEYRTPVGNDANIKQGAVVIHKVHRIGLSYYSSLVTHAGGEYDELTVGTEWVQFLHTSADGSFQYIRVKVLRVHNKLHSADLRIISTFRPETCTMLDSKVEISEEIEGIRRRGVPFLCLNGTRNYTQADIDNQYDRDIFFNVRRTFGLNECRPGREWRAIDAYDYVCVPPSRVLEAASEVLAMDSSHSGCHQGVHRMAFHGDRACVSQEEHNRVQRENSESHKYLANYAFFNGADTVGP